MFHPEIAMSSYERDDRDVTMSFGETPANSRENFVKFELKAEDFFGGRQNHKTDKGRTNGGIGQTKRQ